jgi:tripartite-type tricarboxylate transporter receptor subunit TctC
MAQVSPKKTQTLLQQGMAFYKGQNITIVSPSSPGGPLDLFARVAGPFLGAYLHANVEIENSPGGNTYPGQDLGNAAPPDGKTLFEVNAPADLVQQLQNAPALNFNPKHVAFVGASAPVANIILALTTPACSQYSSLESLKTATTPPSFLIQTTGTPTETAQAWMSLLGIKPHYIPGYTTNAALVNGFTRGDGCVAMLSVTSGGALIQAGVARLLAATVPLPAGVEYRSIIDKPGVPTLASSLAAIKSPTALQKRQITALIAFDNLSGMILNTQTAVAPDKLTALRAALAWAFKQPTMQQQLDIQALSPIFVDGTTTKNEYVEELSIGSSLLCTFANDCTN